MPRPIPLPMLPDLATPWHLDASCLPTPEGDRWALELSHGNQWDQKWFADNVCGSCPVAAECLDDSMLFRRALGYHPDGVWGGLMKVDRKRLWAQLVADEAEQAGAADGDAA